MKASAVIKKKNVVETVKICRWCLSKCDALKPLGNDEAGQYKRQQLFDCTGFQTEVLPRVPTFLCKKCKSRLAKMYTFRWRCNENIALVNGFIEEQKTVKNEPKSAKDEFTVPDATHDLPLIQRSCTVSQVNGTHECCGNQPDDLFEAEENPIAIKVENEDEQDNSQTNPSELICQDREDYSSTTNTCINDSVSETIQNGIAAIDAGKILNVGRKRKNDQENTLHRLRSYNLRGHQQVDNDINRNACRKVNRNKEKLHCPHCSATYIRPNQLKIHIRTHADEKPYACKICSTAFKSRNNLARHKKIHNKDEYKQCPHCPSKFVRSSKLKDHIRIHTGEKPYLCKICKKAFYSSSALSQHSKAHNKDKQCPHCPSKFAQSSTLKNHIRIHTDEKPYACKICSTAFTSRSNLAQHKKIHNKDEYKQCPRCPSKFAHSSTLKNHIRIHTGEKPYVCKICKKAFYSSSALSLHSKTHNKDEYKQCPHCPSKFVRSSKLKDHIRIHTDEKPYACKICSKAFRSRSNLTRHKKIHNKS